MNKINDNKDADAIDERWREKYYDKVAELVAVESDRDRLVIALNDIAAHSVDPFSGDKWRNYINEVALKALKK